MWQFENSWTGFHENLCCGVLLKFIVISHFSLKLDNNNVFYFYSSALLNVYKHAVYWILLSSIQQSGMWWSKTLWSVKCSSGRPRASHLHDSVMFSLLPPLPCSYQSRWVRQLLQKSKSVPLPPFRRQGGEVLKSDTFQIRLKIAYADPRAFWRGEINGWELPK
jgi:hypothetical protein